MSDESDDNLVFLPLSLTLKPGADVNGFTVLAAEDANGDQVIDAQDPVFGQLRIWRDLDGDGVTDPGELQSLVQAGVAAIALDAAFVDRRIGGSWFSHESRYADAAGQDRPVYDVWFENKPIWS